MRPAGMTSVALALASSLSGVTSAQTEAQPAASEQVGLARSLRTEESRRKLMLYAGDERSTGRYTIQLGPATPDVRERLVSVRADRGRAAVLLEAIATEAGIEVRGLLGMPDLAQVDVFLESRLLEDAARSIVGSIGWGTHWDGQTLVVQQELPAYPSMEELETASELAYLRAYSRFPDHPEADDACITLATINERRQVPAAAIPQYEMLISHHPESDLLPLALWNVAELYTQLGDHQSAAAHLDHLGGLGIIHPYHIQSRIRLADALCELDDPRKALFVLKALTYLDRSELTSEVKDPYANEVEKLLVTARAQSLLGEPYEAFAALEGAKRADTESRYSGRILTLEALAFESSGRLGEASLAWLKSAHSSTSMKDRATGAGHAARLALEVGDDMGTIVIDRWAEQEGLQDSTQQYAQRARERLGLTRSLRSAKDIVDELERAEQLMGRNLPQSALEHYSRVATRRAELSQENTVRWLEGYAQALASVDRVEDARMIMRDVTGQLEDPKLRHRVYLTAAQIFETAGLFESALDALGGKL